MTTVNETKKRVKEFVGKVVSNKMDKTVVVAVERKFPHHFMKNKLRKQKSFMPMMKKTNVMKATS